MSAHSAGAYTATLLVMVNVIRGGGRAPPPSPARANFTLITECTPESSGCNSVYSVVSSVARSDSTVSEDAGIEPRAVETSTLACRDALTTRLETMV